MTPTDLSPVIPPDTTAIYFLQFATQAIGVFATTFVFINANNEHISTPAWICGFGMNDFANFESQVANWKKNVAMYESDTIMAVSYERQNG